METAGGHYFSCRDVIIYLPDLEGDPAFSMRMPTYQEDFPTAREVASRRRAMRFLGPALADHIDEYRSTPKLFPALGESARAYDTHGRLWVGTRTTEARDSSEVDLYDGAHYIGTVLIRDALLGLDLLDSIMVALVERPVGPGDADGIRNLALDWYDISGVDFGRKASQDGDCGLPKAVVELGTLLALGRRDELDEKIDGLDRRVRASARENEETARSCQNLP